MFKILIIQNKSADQCKKVHIRRAFACSTFTPNFVFILYLTYLSVPQLIVSHSSRSASHEPPAFHRAEQSKAGQIGSDRSSRVVWSGAEWSSAIINKSTQCTKIVVWSLHPKMETHSAVRCTRKTLPCFF